MTSAVPFDRHPLERTRWRTVANELSMTLVVRRASSARRLLRARHERPRDRCAAEECDEVAPSHANCPSRTKPTKGQRCASQQNCPANVAVGQNEKVSQRAFLDRLSPR